MGEKVVFEFGGHLGNVVIKNKVETWKKNSLGDKVDKVQKKIWGWCNLINEHLFLEFFNIEEFQSLDVELERFVMDENYYHYIYKNQKHTYNLFVGWFMEESNKYWKDVSLFCFGKERMSDKLFELIDKTIDQHQTLKDMMEDENQSFSQEKFWDYINSYYEECSVEKYVEVYDKRNLWDNENIKKGFRSMKV